MNSALLDKLGQYALRFLNNFMISFSYFITKYFL